MRSFLQFLGSASTALCIALLSGALISSSARADDEPVIVTGGTCRDCCTCSAQDRACNKGGASTGCASYSCNCNCFQSGNYWLCQPK